MKREIYISYAWSEGNKIGETREQLVNKLYQMLLKKRFNIQIDKKNIQYKGDIKKFEEQLGKGKFIILIISDKFLKSEHCMFEILKILQNGKIYHRIFPIMMNDAKIYDEYKRIDYFLYWDKKIEKLNNKILKLKNPIGTGHVIEKLNQYHDIRRIFDEITEILRRMNTFSSEIHLNNNFSYIIEAITSKDDKLNNPKRRVLVKNEEKFKAIHTIQNDLPEINKNIKFRPK